MKKAAAEFRAHDQKEWLCIILYNLNSNKNQLKTQNVCQIYG